MQLCAEALESRVRLVDAAGIAKPSAHAGGHKPLDLLGGDAQPRRALALTLGDQRAERKIGSYTMRSGPQPLHYRFHRWLPQVPMRLLEVGLATTQQACSLQP
jgi:hypothetical protein